MISILLAAAMSVVLVFSGCKPKTPSEFKEDWFTMPQPKKTLINTDTLNLPVPPPQPETLKVRLDGWPGSFLNPSDTVTFCWTNLVCETRFKPIVTQSNGMWVIRFSPSSQIEYSSSVWINDTDATAITNMIKKIKANQ